MKQNRRKHRGKPKIPKQSRRYLKLNYNERTKSIYPKKRGCGKKNKPMVARKLTFQRKVSKGAEKRVFIYSINKVTNRIIMEKETEIDCMKYRKSTHLAGVDVEMIIAEKGSCVLTIKEAYYARGVNVSGNKTDGYFLDFEENVKSMVANSGNRARIAKMLQIQENFSAIDSRNIANWAGRKIELVFDPTIKMMGQVVGGIVVKPTSPIPDISDENAIKVLNESKTLPELQSNWGKLSRQEQALPSVVKVKDDLKLTLKTN